MLYYNFCGFDGFNARFGMLEHGNGEKSRRNRILLTFIKNKELLHQAQVSGDYSLLHISSMAELKKTMFERIQESGRKAGNLTHLVQLINYQLWSSKYETDSNKGLCEDGDFKACRYINHDSNDSIFKMKAGKFIRSLILETPFGKTLPEQVLIYLQECFAQDWQTFSMSTLPKNHLFVNKEFRRIYDAGSCVGNFHSCMCNKGYHTFYRDAVDASAAYLENEDGDIIARCIIYNKVHEVGSDKIWRLAERQYSTDQSDTLKRALVDALIREGKCDGFKGVGYDCHSSRNFVDLDGNSLEDKKFWIECDLETYDTLSYQDSFKWYDYSEGRAYNYDEVSYDYELDTTEGSIDGDDEDDDSSYDEYHDHYGDFALVGVYVHGDWLNCSEDDLEDFERIPGVGWVHTDDISTCPVCGKRFITDDGRKSDTTGNTYCCSECKDKAEEEHKEEVA